MSSAATVVCPRHGEIRPPMPMPIITVDGLVRCHCGRLMLPPSVIEHNRKLLGSWSRV